MQLIGRFAFNGVPFYFQFSRTDAFSSFQVIQDLDFMLMRFVIDTSLREIIVITAVSAVVFAVLMMIGFKVGIQVPML
jgi:hypothetical protein